MILKKHQNKLLDIVKESGLDPNLFTAGERLLQNSKHFIISLRDAPISFAVQPYEGSFDSFSYRYSQFQESFPWSYIYKCWDASAFFAGFSGWLNDVVRPYLDDINTPSLWQIIDETRSHAKHKLGAPEDFESFSEEEKAQIKLSLNDFRLLIIEKFTPGQEELISVNARLEYLSNAMDKHNKFDWKGTAISTVIAIIIALSLSSEQGNQLFQLFNQVFSNILYLLP